MPSCLSVRFIRDRLDAVCYIKHRFSAEARKPKGVRSTYQKTQFKYDRPLQFFNAEPSPDLAPTRECVHSDGTEVDSDWQRECMRFRIPLFIVLCGQSVARFQISMNMFTNRLNMLFPLYIKMCSYVHIHAQAKRAPTAFIVLRAQA